MIPSGVLIAGGFSVYLYTRLKYEPPAPGFANFTELKQYLHNSPKQRGYVIVEGTVTKLTQNSVRAKEAGIEGASQKVIILTPKGKTSTVCDISTPFLLVDTKGQAIKVTAVHHALKVNQVMEKVRKKQRIVQSSPVTRELMLTFGTRLGLFGYALIEGDEVTPTPKEVDESLSIIVASQKSRRRLLYMCSCFLILSGCTLFVVSFALPVVRVYILLRRLTSVWF